ncbi:hypothetical protein C8R46DRAFT_1038727 [Mycena filopes]|nr:hypothetical protein C8R46DRAFT_1038727 [Mycena filopes]
MRFALAKFCDPLPRPHPVDHPIPLPLNMASQDSTDIQSLQVAFSLIFSGSTALQDFEYQVPELAKTEGGDVNEVALLFRFDPLVLFLISILKIDLPDSPRASRRHEQIHGPSKTRAGSFTGELLLEYIKTKILGGPVQLLLNNMAQYPALPCVAFRDQMWQSHPRLPEETTVSYQISSPRPVITLVKTEKGKLRVELGVAMC